MLWLTSGVLVMAAVGLLDGLFVAVEAEGSVMSSLTKKCEIFVADDCLLTLRFASSKCAMGIQRSL